MPWVYIRAQLAERWHLPPWKVDEAPQREIELQMKLWQIENEARAR